MPSWTGSSTSCTGATSNTRNCRAAGWHCSLIPRAGAQTAVDIERVAFGVLGDVAAAVNAADQATLAKGVNVTLGADVAAAVRTLITDFKSELQAAGVKPG